MNAFEPTTPFPNWLLDEVMPEVTDTEWRLICLVVRQTAGWQREGVRKQWDWLSHHQLKRRSGRASASISHAIQRLVQQGLLEVTTLQGTPLTTPEERRRCQQPMLFRIVPKRASPRQTQTPLDPK